MSKKSKSIISWTLITLVLIVFSSPSGSVDRYWPFGNMPLWRASGPAR